MTWWIHLWYTFIYNNNNIYYFNWHDGYIYDIRLYTTMIIFIILQGRYTHLLYLLEFYIVYIELAKHYCQEEETADANSHISEKKLRGFPLLNLFNYVRGFPLQNLFNAKKQFIITFITRPLILVISCWINRRWS